MRLGGYYHEGTVELEPVETGCPPSIHTSSQWVGSANQEVSALLILNLSDHHFILQRALS